ncbi:MAG: WG repeat-containing protein [Clostridia bacterium]|nr:WG repeat-containing protein [Clostridia bacterium]
MKEQKIFLKETDGKWGYMNEFGILLCPCKYIKARNFREDRAAVKGESGWGFINTQFIEICELRYEEVYDFSNKLAVVKKEGKMCYLDLEGQEVKVVNFLEQEMEYEGCKSCAIGEHRITNLPAGYIYDNGIINLTIDPEIPIKGFLVLGVFQHVSSSTKLNESTRVMIENITNKAKEALEYYGIKQILVFEDGFADHYRRWIIAVDDWMFKYGRGKNLKEITVYAKKNAKKEDIDKVMEFAYKIKEYFH